jgi:Zn-dependent peptidase ImmA (M78 family)
MLLKLSFKELVSETVEPSEPVVAFRRKRSRKTDDAHLERARHMGMLLRRLVPYLPFEQLQRPATLRDPVCEYQYLQRVAQAVRRDLNIEATASIPFQCLIEKFAALYAVIVPVLWGDKKHHENALHIYLPDSMTTWVYLNLDSHIPDFNFWMAHELAHVLAPSLRDDEGEDFADGFAQALLFPEPCVEQAYSEAKRQKGRGARVNLIKETALRFRISPTTVNLCLEKYAETHQLKRVDVGQDIYAAATNFNKEHGTVRELLFRSLPPSAADYIATSGQAFKTPFFDALKRYTQDSDASLGFVETVLQIPVRDAREILTELR